MKKIAVIASFFLVNFIFSQEKEKINFFGGFESNSQWYLNDNGLRVVHPENPVRSNNYLLLNLKYKNWNAGVQVESYAEKALLNFNPEYKKTNVGTYYFQYKAKKIDLTAGYFYEQFGSGLLFRSWEDRTLGLNNSLRGGRVIFKPTDFLTFKTIAGQQRSGFKVSNGRIYGFDAEIGLSKALKFESTELGVGFTYVGRDEEKTEENPKYASLTNAFAGRINFSRNSFYLSSEYNYKSKDAIVEAQQLENDFIKPGTALLMNLGYSKKGFGIDGTFRRLENMSFYSERKGKGNLYNDKIMNFVPSLTKQHHNNLANIYVYQAQPNVSMLDESVLKSGEIGGQIDVFYTFKKGTSIGGNKGTKVALNCSNWFGLNGYYSISDPRDYKSDFMAFGKKYFSDYNIEITKKWNDKWQSIFLYINQYYNKKQIEETYGLVKTNIISLEATYKISPSKSVRILAEHMWADSDKKNWASSTVEFNANSKLSFFASDIYNYGNDNLEARNHYYNIGSSYRKNSTRVAFSYGRQRGSLMCVGGVCRIVPESTGNSLSLNTAF